MWKKLPLKLGVNERMEVQSEKSGEISPENSQGAKGRPVIKPHEGRVAHATGFNTDKEKRMEEGTLRATASNFFVIQEVVGGGPITPV